MDINELQHVVGEARTDEVATIKFFGKVTEERTQRFNEEFDWLENCVKPSMIKVLINSEGGSVLYGMNTYSTIQGSSIPTECVNEGLAASMGSVLWAAGTKSTMRDYAILMIHNPFISDGSRKPDDSDTPDIVKAFSKQLETIYRKRFGLTKAQVRAIMTGEEGKDGTYFDAEQAVRAGIIPDSNVIRTSKQVCDKVKNEISNLSDVTAVQEIMAKVSCELDADELKNKQTVTIDANINKTPETNQVQKQKTKHDMEETKTVESQYAAVAASLGFTGTYEIKDVMAKLSNLMSVEANLKTAQKSLEDAQTVIAGHEAAKANIQKELDTVKADLDVYKAKDIEEQKAKVEAIVDAAVTAGKISAESKEQWVKMAESNFELASTTLASIPAPAVISKEIAKTPEQIAAAQVDATAIMEKAVAEAVGKDFQFKTLE